MFIPKTTFLQDPMGVTCQTTTMSHRYCANIQKSNTENIYRWKNIRIKFKQMYDIGLADYYNMYSYLETII